MHFTLLDLHSTRLCRTFFPRWARQRLPALFLICIASLSLAAQAEPDKEVIDCNRVNNGYGNTYEMNVCADRLNRENESKLEKVLKKLRASLTIDLDKKTLDESQKIWSSWKAKEAQLCALTMGYTPDGSGYGMQVSYCAANLTNQRTVVLQKYLKEVQSR